LSRYAAFLTFASIALLSPLNLYSQGYGGPSLLSRGGNQPGQRGRGPVDFNVYAAIRGTHETGLLSSRLDNAGNLVSQDLNGVQAELGAYGAKSWRRTSVGLDYRGDYRKYFPSMGYDGTNQALSLDMNYQPTRRTAYFLRETGGISNRAFGGFAAPAFSDQENFGVPLNEVYDSRIYFTQTSGGVSYRKSARTTLSVMGEGFVVKRTSRALIGLQGYRAGGDYQYQISRADTVGISYDYIHFEFPRIYGASGAHSVTGRYSRRVNRNWDFKLIVGFFDVETTGTQRVELSPEIAAILGRSQGVEAFKRSVREPQFDLTANYTLEHSHFTVGYQSGIGPGNGIYITSRQDGVRAGYSYSGLKRLSMGASVGYTRFQSLGLQLGDYKTIQGGGGINYKLAEYLNLSVQADRRKFDSPAIKGRSGTSITVGLSFSPARLPLPIW
jgi:hypothetical protein